MSENVSNFITTLVMHFPVKHESPEREKEWLSGMASTLRGYGASTLAKAATLLVETRKDRRFPLPAECREACNEIIRRDQAQKSPTLPLDQKFPEFSGHRIQLAEELICSGGLGKRAAKEAWILSLHDFCRHNLRLPQSDAEIRKCIDGARGFDEAYEKWVRGEYSNDAGLTAKFIQLGDSMLARREHLRSMVLDGVVR